MDCDARNPETAKCTLCTCWLPAKVFTESHLDCPKAKEGIEGGWTE